MGSFSFNWHIISNKFTTFVPKLFGKGLQGDKTRSRRSLPVYVPRKGSSLLNYDVLSKPNYGIPPIHGSWENQVGFGFNKKTRSKKGKGIITSMLGIRQSQTWNKIPNK